MEDVLEFMYLGHRIGSPKELMCQDELNVSEEEEVYEAVITWVKLT